MLAKVINFGQKDANHLSKIVIMARNVAKSPCSSLFYTRIELLETNDKSIQRTAIDHSLRELVRVLNFWQRFLE